MFVGVSSRNKRTHRLLIRKFITIWESLRNSLRSFEVLLRYYCGNKGQSPRFRYRSKSKILDLDTSRSLKSFYPKLMLSLWHSHFLFLLLLFFPPPPIGPPVLGSLSLSLLRWSRLLDPRLLRQLIHPYSALSDEVPDSLGALPQDRRA